MPSRNTTSFLPSASEVPVKNSPTQTSRPGKQVQASESIPKFCRMALSYKLNLFNIQISNKYQLINIFI